jgi:hypothetical protein
MIGRSRKWTKLHSEALACAERLGSRFVSRSAASMPMSGPETAGKVSLRPIPLRPIAESRRVRSIQFGPLLTEGALSLSGDGFEMYARSTPEQAASLKSRYDDPDDAGRTLPVRTRFTIAHEIAHTFFFALAPGSPKPTVPGVHHRQLAALENTCNDAARHLLLPRPLVRAIADQISDMQPQSIRQAARDVGVSIETLVRRLDPLDLWIDGEGLLACVEQASPQEAPRFRFTARSAAGRHAFSNATFGHDVCETILPNELTVFGGLRPSMEVTQVVGGLSVTRAGRYRISCECLRKDGVSILTIAMLRPEQQGGK